jgi:transcriptional regulator with XRE-family HTH domain
MSGEPHPLAAAIGARVRKERQARQWTLDGLAEAAGVSRRSVVSVEQGEANPSIATLLRISDALGVGLPALVEPPVMHAVTVLRRADRPVLWHGDAGGSAALVAATAPPDVVELWDWELAPGERHASEAHAPGTKELLQVLDGELSIEVGSETVVLDVGDAVGFPGDVPHAYVNAGSVAARFSLAVYEPNVGRGAGRPVSEPGRVRSFLDGPSREPVEGSGTRID